MPSVVGYSRASDNTFGWIFGPSPVVDAKGGVSYEQRTAVHDLSVDLSVPAWWPLLTLEVTTLWVSSPNEVMSIRQKGGSSTSSSKISLSREAADEFDALTNHLLDRLNSAVVISGRIEGGPVKACAPSTLLITGPNVWRTRQVHVLGHILGSDAIHVSPDMKGIWLDVPAIATPQGATLERTLLVMTSLGRSEAHPVDYLPQPTGDGCKATPAPAEAVAFVVSGVAPAEFVVPSSFEMTVTGLNLDKVGEVRLYGQPGSLSRSRADKGKVLSITFGEKATGAIPASGLVSLEFFEQGKSKPTHVSHIRIQRK